MCWPDDGELNNNAVGGRDGIGSGKTAAFASEKGSDKVAWLWPKIKPRWLSSSTLGSPNMFLVDVV